MTRSGFLRPGLVLLASLATLPLLAQVPGIPWAGYARDPQHSGLSPFASQPLVRVRWQTPVDRAPQYSGTALLIHYGSPVITPANTLVLPVKTAADGGFQIEARRGATGRLIWSLPTDYVLPPHDWTPACSVALTNQSRVYVPGEGGTVLWRDAVDTLTGASGRLAYYGNAAYGADPAAYRRSVFINTPLTVDRAGNVYFGVQVTGATPAGLQSGLVRLSPSGAATFVAAGAAAGDGSVRKVVHNCAPALSRDQRTVYVAVSNGDGRGFATGYLLALDAQTLATKAAVRLKDWNSGQDAFLPEAGTASPTVGPDGDVYFGVLENPFPSNHDRGWLLHFDANLRPTGAVGAFGWDDTASVVPASMVPSYTGGSPYLLMTKYNHYAGIGGDGVNKLAILDPRVSQIDPVTGASVMREVLTVAGVTPDQDHLGGFPNAVREWCINTAAVDPATKSVLANSEDGKLYRWDLTTNSLTETVVLTPGIGEAYTPTLIGVDGTVYAINNGTLFAVGK